MISTKMSPKEAKEYNGDVAPSDAPAYSYGTCLCLDNELLERLGLTDLPAVGTEFTLTAKVVVTSTRASQEQDGDKRLDADLQITEMELGAAGSASSAADVLYGGAA